MSEYISLINETEFTGNINATSVTFNGTVDFTDADPIIGLVDNTTLELFTYNLLPFNRIRIKDAGVTDVKIVSMDANKLTGNIFILPNLIYIKLSLVPYDDATMNLGAALLRYLNVYCVNMSISSSLNVPIINYSTGVIIQYNGINRILTTTVGVSIIGILDTSIINNISGISLQHNNSTKLSVTSNGITVSGIADINTINNVTGTNLQYNGVTKLSTVSSGINVIGTADINIINNLNGVNLQYNTSTKIATVPAGVYIYGNLSIIGAITTTYNSDTNTLTTSGGGFNLNVSSVIALNGPVVRCNQILDCENDNLFDIGSSGGNRFRSAYLGTSCVVPVINNSSGISLQHNNITKLSVKSNGCDVIGLLKIIGAITTTYDPDTNTLTTSGGGFNITTSSVIGLNGTVVRCREILDCASDNLFDIGSIGFNRFRTAYLATSCVTPIINNNSGSVSIQYNGSNRYQTTASGSSFVNGSIDLNNNNIINANTVTSQTLNALTLTGSTDVNLNISTGPTNSVYIGGNQIKNKKIVLYTHVAGSEHDFYGWGVNNGVLRYQVATIASAHVFYASTSSTTSQELFRIIDTGLVSQRSLNMSSNAITNVSSISVTTLNSTNVVATGTVKTGGVVGGHRSITSNTTLLETDYIASVDTSSISITITLPLISTLTYSTGRQFVIKDVSGFATKNNIIVITTSPNLLDGKSRWIINSKYASMSIYTNGTNYFIM